MSADFNIRNIATLARLNLSPEEERIFESQLGGIIEYVDTLSRFDLGDAEPTAHAMPIYDVMRPDESRPSMTQEQALGNAPKRSGNQFQITKVIE